MSVKKRVGIISLFHENINYGGVLQAYALRKVIADMGYECEQIRFDRTPQNIPYESLSKKIPRLTQGKTRNFVSVSSVLPDLPAAK